MALVHSTAARSSSRRQAAERYVFGYWFIEIRICKRALFVWSQIGFP